MDIFITIISLIAVALPVFNISAYYILRKASKTEDGRRVKALQERTQVAFLLMIASIMMALLAFNSLSFTFFKTLPIPVPVPLALIICVVFLISLPSMIFLKRYFRDGFIDDI